MTTFIEGQAVKYVLQIDNMDADIPLRSVGRYVDECLGSEFYQHRAEFDIITEDGPATIVEYFKDGELEDASE